MKKLRAVVLATCILLMGVQGAVSTQAAGTDIQPRGPIMLCPECLVGKIELRLTPDVGGTWERGRCDNLDCKFDYEYFRRNNS